VAMTRARQHLDLMVPQRFYVTQQHRHGDRHMYGARSRFLPPELLPLFTPATPRADGSEPTRPTTQVMDLREKLRSRWA